MKVNYAKKSHIYWTIDSELDFVRGIGSWSRAGTWHGRDDLLKRYIKAHANSIHAHHHAGISLAMRILESK